jgi:hypothetical protein
MIFAPTNEPVTKQPLRRAFRRFAEDTERERLRKRESVPLSKQRANAAAKFSKKRSSALGLHSAQSEFALSPPWPVVIKTAIARVVCATNARLVRALDPRRKRHASATANDAVVEPLQTGQKRRDRR